MRGNSPGVLPAGKAGAVHMKEGNYAFRWTRLSCKRSRDNEVRLQLRALATIWPPCLTLHRTARGHRRRVADQPATEADQDRGRRRGSRPRHHLPAGRGRGHRPHGQGHPRRDPPITGTAVMCVTAILTETERKRQDRSACRAEKRRCRARMMRLRGPIHPQSSVPATADDA